MTRKAGWWALGAVAGAVVLGCGGAGSVLKAITVTPQFAVADRAGTVNFTYSVVTGGRPDVVWSTSAGSITQTGTFTAPNFDGFVEVRAALQAEPAVSDSGFVAVGAGSGGFILQEDVELGIGETMTLTAGFIDVTDDACDWFTTQGVLKPSTAAACATLIEAPRTPGNFSVVARNRQNDFIFGRRDIKVNAISVAVSPQGIRVPGGEKRTFTALVTGPRNTGVIWQADRGFITDEGEWTAPATAGTAIITARSAANPDVIGTAVVTVE